MELDNRLYYQVAGWMINDLHLKGNELKCYAVIYSLSQLGQGLYNAGLDFLAKFMQVSQPTASCAIDGLLKKGLIDKAPVITEKGRKVLYFCTDGDNKKFIDGDNKNLIDGVNKKFMVPNKYNIIDNKNKGKSISNDIQKVEDELFTIFWDKYGYKKGKENAKKAWRKLNDKEKDLAIKAIDEYKEDCRRNQRQMKHPTTYINQKTWEDDFSYDGMVDESEEVTLPKGMTIEDWLRCHNWLAKYTPRISGLITPKAYVEMKELAQDKELMAKILHYINDSDYRGDLVREFKRLIETGEYKESV